MYILNIYKKILIINNKIYFKLHMKLFIWIQYTIIK